MTPQQETSEEAAARYAREWTAQQGAASGAAAASSSAAAAAPSGAAASSSGAAASSSGPAAGAKRKDAEIQKRLVAKNLGTTVKMMDAQAQALQDAAKKADTQLTRAAVQTPVPKRLPAPGRATRKTLKGSVTKGTVNAPELKNALYVKRINAQATKLSKPIEQEDVIMMKTGKPVKPAPKTKPVKKLNLKDKSSELAKKIKNTVERKGAKVKKDKPDKAIRDLGKRTASSAAADRMYVQQEAAQGSWRTPGLVSASFNQLVALAKRTIKKPPKGP